MSYAVIEDALVATLATMDDIGEENISKADYTILNMGLGKSIIVEYSQLGTAAFAGGYTQSRLWTINIFIFVQYIDDAQVHEEMNVLRQAILDKVQEHPTFNCELVFDANIVSGRVLPPNSSQDDVIETFWEVLECQVQENKLIPIQ